MPLGRIKQLIYEYPARSLARQLPLNAGAALGATLAAVEYATLRPASRRRLREKLGEALELSPDSDEIHVLARSLIRHHVWHLLEYGLPFRLAPQDTGPVIEVAGLEHAKQVLETGRGLFVAAGHLCTWVLYPAVFSWLGYETALIERDMSQAEGEDHWLSRQKMRVRKRLQQSYHGYETIHTGGARKRALGVLRRGGVVVMAVDYPPAKATRTMPFLGRQRGLPTGAASLVLDAGAGTVSAQLERLSFGHKRLTLEPVEIPKTGDPKADTFALARTFAQNYERFIRAHPDHWSWQLWRELGD